MRHCFILTICSSFCYADVSCCVVSIFLGLYRLIDKVFSLYYRFLCITVRFLFRAWWEGRFFFISLWCPDRGHYGFRGGTSSKHGQHSRVSHLLLIYISRVARYIYISRAAMLLAANTFSIYRCADWPDEAYCLIAHLLPVFRRHYRDLLESRYHFIHFLSGADRYYFRY